MASFDRIAKIYEPLEKLTFADRLQHIRCFCLSYTKDSQRGLLIGDGDGRFSKELLRSNSNIQLDSIDISPSMLEVAQQNAGEHISRLNAIEANATKHTYPKNLYNFIALHFCLDCFEQDEIDQLLPQIKGSLTPGGLLAYSDFQAERAWQKMLVRALYFSFRTGAGLQTKRLPAVDWGPEFDSLAEEQAIKGLVFSRVLRKR